LRSKSMRSTTGPKGVAAPGPQGTWAPRQGPGGSTLARTPLRGPFLQTLLRNAHSPFGPGLPLSLLRKPGQARSADVAKT
jgi:hypothetical protein